MKIIIAGGGTGGHLFSGLAVATEWKKRGGEILFVGTKLGLEKDLVKKYGFALQLITVTRIKGRGIFDKLKTLFLLPVGLVQSALILSKEKPDIVLGIGGYASGPLVLMALLFKLKTAVIDQNSVPGFTNRFLGKWTKRVYLTFSGSTSYFQKEKIRLFGNPVMDDRKPASHPSVSSQKLLLVCGGSQGAHALNEKFMQASGDLAMLLPGLRICHQTGKSDFEAVSDQMKKKGINAEVLPFIDDMGEKYQQARLVISRSGAGTLTELALWGLPSLLVPYPFAADDHQKKNAEEFQQKGAAEIIEQKDLTASKLAERVIALFSDENKLKEMSRAALSLAKPDAARDVVADLMAL